MNRTSKALVIFGALLIWYALVGFLIAPALIRHFGEAQLKENFNPDSSIAKVRINPFTGAFRVEGLQVSDLSGTWSLAWEKAEINLSGLTLLRFYPVVDVVRLTGADARYEYRAKAESVETVEPADGGDGDWRALVERLNLTEIPELRVDLLEVTDGRFEFIDHSSAELFTKTIDPINFTLRDFTTVVEGDSAMRFVAVSDEGASLSWEGDFQSRPIRSSGNLKLSGLAVHDLSPYYSRFIRFKLQRANFDLNLDYRLDLSDVDNLFQIESGQVELLDVLCEPVDQDNQLISIDSVRAEGLGFRFPQMTLDLASFRIETGETRIFRNAGGQINLAQLIVLPESADTPEPKPAEPTERDLPGLSYRIDEVSLRDYRIVWEDALEAGTANLEVNIPRMDITGLSSDLDVSFQLTAEYAIGDSGTASVEGSVTPMGPTADLQMNIESVPLDLLSPYARQFGRTEIREGTFDFDGRFQYTGGGEQTLSGDAKIRQIDLQYDGSLQTSWSLLAISGMRLDLSPFALAMETVALEQPEITYRLNPGADEAEAAPEASSSVAADTSLPIRIDALTVSDGRLSFNDGRFDPTPEIKMEAFKLELSGLDLDGGDPAKLSLSTQINGSPFQLNGEINANRYKEATRLQATLSGLSLPAFSAYSGQAVGRLIANGSFELESDWTIEASQLKASNKIRIDQFELGDSVPSESAVSLPLDLAVTLLKGPGGVMDLSLPLSGDLSDPKVGVGQIVRTALVGLVTNVAAAPFKLLSGLVGTEADLSVVSFAPGSGELPPAMLKRLNTLAEALKERPGLKLAITPQISGDDEQLLAEAKLRLDLMGDDNPGDEALYRKRLTRSYREAMEASGSPDRETKADTEAGLEKMVAALLPGIEITDTDRAELAAERAAAIREHLELAQGIDANRLTIQDPEVGAAESGAKFDLK